jgi:hypothetical protein
VSQHLQLCRLYVRRLHRSMIEETPDPEKTSKRSSYILDNAGEGPSNNEKGGNDNMSDQRLSAFLRSDRGSRNHSPQNSQGSNQSAELPRPSLMLGTPGDSSSPGQNSSVDNTQPRREDLRASAEKILYTYLLPGSEREIIIPQSILAEIQDAIEGPEQRADPELFDPAKDYVFQAMERDAYPGFLQAKGLGNLVTQSMMMRLIVGLISFFAAIWAAFILIFLDKSRSTRCWVRSTMFLPQLSANNSSAHPSFHSRHLPHLHTPVHARPHHRPGRLQRVHSLRLQQDPRTVRPQDSQQALTDRLGHVCPLHHSRLLSLYIRSG